MVNNNYAFHVKNLGSRLHAGSRTVLGKSFEAEKISYSVHWVRNYLACRIVSLKVNFFLFSLSNNKSNTSSNVNPPSLMQRKIILTG